MTKDKTFLKITNNMVYEKLENIEDTLKNLCLKQDKTNGHVAENQRNLTRHDKIFWILSTGFGTVILFILGWILTLHGGKL